MLNRGLISAGLLASAVLCACGGRLSARPPVGGFVGSGTSRAIGGSGLSWLVILLAGVALGLVIAHVRRRWALRKALRQEHGLALGREISRLESALLILDDLLVNWPRRDKVVDLLRRLKRRDHR